MWVFGKNFEAEGIAVGIRTPKGLGKEGEIIIEVLDLNHTTPVHIYSTLEELESLLAVCMFELEYDSTAENVPYAGLQINSA